MKLLCAPQYTEHQFNFTRNEKKISGIECHVEFWFSRWRQKLFLGHFSEDLWTFDLVGGDLNICFLAENKCSSHGVGKRNRQECRQQNHINHCRDNTRFKTCVICLWLASFSVEGCIPHMYILTPRKQNSSSTRFIFCLWSVLCCRYQKNINSLPLQLISRLSEETFPIEGARPLQAGSWWNALPGWDAAW